MFAFASQTDCIASITVPGDSDFHLDRTNPLQRHRLGLENGPLYTLAQPFASDEGWRIYPNSDGIHLCSKLPEQLMHLPTWLSAKDGTAILNCLPSGTYLLVKCCRRPTQREYIYLGNEPVLATPNMRILMWDETVVDAIIIGSPENVAPRLDCPLLGFVICNHSGVTFPTGSDEKSQHLIVFLSFCDGRNTPAANEDLALIIPVMSELVVDHLQLSTTNTVSFAPVKEDASLG